MAKPKWKRNLSTEPLIATFDIATATGICIGRPSDRYPRVATWDLRAAGKSRPWRLLYFANLCDKFFIDNKVNILRYEHPMPLAVMGRIGTSEETMLLLRGLIGVLEACGARAEIEDIGSFKVQDARQHFLGQRTFRKGANGKSAAKDHVLIMCDALGIQVANDNEADAVAGWSYCCARANPRLAALNTPLFQKTA